MNDSILEASKKARKNGFFGIFKRKSVIFILIAIIIASGAFWYFSKNKKTNTQTLNVPKEWNVKKGDLVVAVSSDGKVVAEDGVKLSFSVSGDTLEVQNVYVKVGDYVKKGDKLASVKTSDLEYNLNKIYANYQSTLANYNEKIAGATEKEIADAKANIDQAKINLEQSKISLEKTKTNTQDKIDAAERAIENTKKEYDKNKNIETSEDVKNAYEDIIDTVKSISILLENMLPNSDKIIGIDNTSINDSFETSLGAKDLATLSLSNSTYLNVKEYKSQLDDEATFLNINDGYAKIDSAVELASKTLLEMENHLFAMQKMLNASVVSANLTQTQLDSFKSTINSNRSSIISKTTALNNNLKSLDSAKDGLPDYATAYNDALKNLETVKSDNIQDIANSESSIASKELALRNAEQNYKDLLAPLSASELASARSSLTTAAINLDQAKNDLSKAILVSPIDGKISALNYKAGDIILSNDSKSVVEIINDKTLYIESNIEEADISKLKIGQKASAVFDSLDGLKLDGEISFISITSDTSNNGIVTYLVRVIFDNPETAEVREGMTASINFVISGVTDVLQIPVSAVRNVNNKPSVELKSGEWVPVSTGFTDGKNVEIISGVKEGDTILY